MKTKLIIGFSIFALIITTLLCSANNKIPKGWYIAGSNPNEYEMGIENSSSESGKSCAFIKSKTQNLNGFGTLMQTISAEKYLEKRLRLSGYIKSEDVKLWSGMWMRIDGENSQQLGFDNMYGREIKGTNDWKRYEIVLDIPSNSKTINYGVLLSGEGRVLFDNFKLEEVDKSVKVTNHMKENDLPGEPINLDFEQ